MCKDEVQVKNQRIFREDIFSELGNIGVGSCMASLSHIIGREVSYSPPSLVRADYESVSAGLGKADENVAGVLINYSGEIEGKCLVIFKASMVRLVMEGVLGEARELAELDGPMMDLLKEAANIMASSYLAAVSSYVSCGIRMEPAAVTSDMAGSILAEAVAGMAENDVCIENLFGAEPEQSDSFMMVLLYEHSVPRFLKALEVEACGS